MPPQHPSALAPWPATRSPRVGRVAIAPQCLSQLTPKIPMTPTRGRCTLPDQTRFAPPIGQESREAARTRRRTSMQTPRNSLPTSVAQATPNQLRHTAPTNLPPGRCRTRTTQPRTTAMLAALPRPPRSRRRQQRVDSQAANHPDVHIES